MKRMIAISCALAFAACGEAEYQTADVSTAEGVIAALNAAADGGKVLFGHQDDTAYGHNWRFEADRSDVRDVCSDYPAILGWDIGGIELGNSENLDLIPFDLIRRLIVEHYERGGVSTISWHANNPVTGGDSWDISDHGVVDAILEGGTRSELFREWLRRAGDFLESLRTSDGTPVPVIFRPWHEHTGSWFWWGDAFRTPDRYKQLWHMTIDYLRSERGLDNLVTAYSPGSGIDREKYMETYPGDDCVDLLGIDIYHMNAEQGLREYRDGLDLSLGLLEDLGRELGKPVAVTETGAESVPMERWWTDVLYESLKESRVSYVLVWRNAWDRPDHFYAPYPGQLSAENFTEFRSLPGTVFLDDIKNIKLR